MKKRIAIVSIVLAALALPFGCCSFEAINARVRTKSTLDLVVLEPDRTPAAGVTVTTQESGWRHIVRIPWVGPAWVARHKPKTHLSETNGLCRIRFGDEMLKIISVSRSDIAVTNYVVIQDFWWAPPDKRKRRPDSHPSWHRGYHPKTQELLGNKAEMILDTEQDN